VGPSVNFPSNIKKKKTEFFFPGLPPSPTPGQAWATQVKKKKEFF
jgi:hypothetical protein